MPASAFRWLVSLIGIQLLCAIVWFLGPLLPALEDWLPRLAVVLGLAVAWVIGNLVLDLRRLARDRALARGVAGGETARSEEAAALQDKLATAMTLLRRAKGRRGALYEQPWYVIIGPPGAGKTTALLNAGLRFPLAEQLGAGAVAGVGGTRLCEWWFTDDAVLIDTAGRYTTQDSDAEVDRAGWDSFLGLLKSTRPRQPLNGVLVAIALTDVVAEQAGDRLAHARAIRRRIAELEARLGLRLPVYALFTKADLLAGFSEFFADLDQTARGQVWGVTFPLAASTALPDVAAEFQTMAADLDRRMFDRLQAEPGPERRALISAFPGQFATIGAPVQEFLAAAFGPAGTGAPPLLRGVYLTSATQEGTPIDRLTGALARAFGIDQRQARQLRPEAGRSYFLASLLRDVVFREAMLASDRPAVRRRRTLVRVAGFAACLLLAAAGAGLLLRERAGVEARLTDAAAALSRYEAQAAALPLDPVQDADLPRLAPLLDGAAAVARGPGEAAGRLAWLGLAQDGKLAAGGRALYRHALEHALLPRLVWRLEVQMRGALSAPDLLYEATRVYLMLGGGGPLDRDLVREWMSLDWEASYPGEASAALRASLLRHLDALLDEPLPPVPLDGDLVAAARSTFGRVSVAQRIYSRIKPSAAAARLPPWRPSDALGPAGVRVFVRASGQKLTEGIAGFYTPEGFHTVLLPSLGRALQEVAAESWVLGEKTELAPDSPAMRAAEHDVVALYLRDYAQAWDAMLGDLEVAPLRSLTQAAQDLYILGSGNSPMRALLASLAQQLTLAPAAPQAAAPAEPGRGRLAALLGRASAAETAAAVPGQEIDARYRALRELMQPGVIDQVLKPLIDLQQQLAKIAASASRAGATPDPASADPAIALRTEALRQPPPLSRWLNAVAASGLALRGGGARQQITAAFTAGGGPGGVCPAVVNNKYPFSPNAAVEASVEEFSRLFAPGGAIDAFFNTQLKPYVDTSARPWKAQAVEGVAAPVSAADLAQFQRAAAIRDLFFAGGSRAARLRFDLTPTGKDAGATSVTLDLGSATLTFADGPPRPAQVTWPAANKAAPVKLSWEPGGTALQESGAWALFRLFGHAKVQPVGSDRATITLQSGEHRASFELRAAPNPFTSTLLQDFRCPSLQ